MIKSTEIMKLPTKYDNTMNRASAYTYMPFEQCSADDKSTSL
jgi:hypothetical protein